jgi:hypothetical protein
MSDNNVKFYRIKQRQSTFYIKVLPTHWVDMEELNEDKVIVNVRFRPYLYDTHQERQLEDIKKLKGREISEKVFNSVVNRFNAQLQNELITNSITT